MVIGIIGLGEVGSRFAAGLTRAGHAEIFGYDPHIHIGGTREKEIRLRKSGELFLLKKQKSVILLEKAGFTTGTPEEFRSFFRKAAN